MEPQSSDTKWSPDSMSVMINFVQVPVSVGPGWFWSGMSDLILALGFLLVCFIMSLKTGTLTPSL